MGLQRVVGRGPGGKGCKLVNMILESGKEHGMFLKTFGRKLIEKRNVLSTSRGFIFTHTSGGGVATSVVRVSLFWRERQVGSRGFEVQS